MADTVFYSWQSDLPNSTNRGFIHTALEAATKTLRENGSVQVEPVVDRDTAGVPGSPDIFSTILGKIDESLIFVCDVSVINKGANEETRFTPNPNVLIELGYALKALGQHRIIMVMNTAFGTVEQLPFDLRLKRVLTYNAPPAESERASERKKLQGALEYCLRDILLAPLRQPEPELKVVQIAASGRWQSIKDLPGEKFGSQREGQLTPDTVKLKPGEVYRFRADFGLQDADLGTLMELATQPQFHSLVLYKCKHIAESALCSLLAFRHLKVLDLADTNTTDKVLESLRRMTSLKMLNVKGCSVSSATVEQLRKALPNCKIVA
ncbi:MAG: hypothetical protein ABSB42_18205 [Tepidisphaeraceae bacterium]